MPNEYMSDATLKFCAMSVNTQTDTQTDTQADTHTHASEHGTY